MSSQFRPLLIKTTTQAPSTSPTGPPETTPAHQQSNKKRRNRHDARAWEEQKAIFIELYCTQGKSLEEATGIIEQRCGFKASVRLWKNKIREWGLEKNISASNMRILVAKRNKRVQESDKDTVFYFHDNKIDNERLDRFVQRQKSTDNYPSPSVATPFGLTYHTPQTILSPESLCDGANDALVSQCLHHYTEVSLVTSLKVNAETISQPQGLQGKTACDAHQRADQGIVCIGRFANTQRAVEMLAHSYNLGVILHNLLEKSTSTVVWPESPASLGASTAPLFWADWSDPNAASNPKLQHVIGQLKQSHLCRNLFARSHQDRLNWVKEWRQMTDADGSKAMKLGTSLFGDPSIPYRGTRFFTLWIKFKTTSELDCDILLRLSLGDDLEPTTKECGYCHNAVMLLDLVDRTGAVKLNVPLTSLRFRRLFSDSKEYLKTFNVKFTTKKAQWSELTYLHEGWSLFYACGRRQREPHSNRSRVSLLVRESNVWDPNADPEQNTRFEPYPADSFWHVKQDKWVEESSDLDDDSDSNFDPHVSDDREPDYFDPSPLDYNDQYESSSDDS